MKKNNQAKKQRVLWGKRNIFLFSLIGAVISAATVSIPISLFNTSVVSNLIVSNIDNRTVLNIMARTDSAPVFPFTTNSVSEERDRLLAIFQSNDNQAKLTELMNYFQGEDLTLENIPLLDFNIRVIEDSLNPALSFSILVRSNFENAYRLLDGRNNAWFLNRGVRVTLNTPSIFEPGFLTSAFSTITTQEEFSAWVTPARTNSKNDIFRQTVSTNYTGINEAIYQLFDIRFFTDRSAPIEFSQLLFNINRSISTSFFYLPQIFLNDTERAKGFTVNGNTSVTGSLVTFVPNR